MCLLKKSKSQPFYKWYVMYVKPIVFYAIIEEAHKLAHEYTFGIWFYICRLISMRNSFTFSYSLLLTLLLWLICLQSSIFCTSSVVCKFDGILHFAYLTISHHIRSKEGKQLIEYHTNLDQRTLSSRLFNQSPIIQTHFNADDNKTDRWHRNENKTTGDTT